MKKQQLLALLMACLLYTSKRQKPMKRLRNGLFAGSEERTDEKDWSGWITEVYRKLINIRYNIDETFVKR